MGYTIIIEGKRVHNQCPNWRSSTKKATRQLKKQHRAVVARLKQTDGQVMSLKAFARTIVSSEDGTGWLKRKKNV